MAIRSNRTSRTAILLGAGLVFLLLASCTGRAAPGGSTAPLDPGATPAAALPGQTPVATTQPAASSTQEDAPAATTLTWWTAPFFAPSEESEAGQLLAASLDAFSRANPTLSVRPILKAPYGKGGLLDYLLASQKTAPSLLPDLIVLSSDDLGLAIRSGLLQPLDDLLAPELFSDLYPFALQEGRQEGKLYAVQFEADIEHLVVNTDQVQQPPRTWTDLLNQQHTYIFSVGSANAPSDAFLLQYKAAGGVFGGRDDAFILDDRALFQVLDFYAQGRAGGLIPASVLALNNVEDSWAIFQSGRADMTNALASRYISERPHLTNITFASLPTVDGRPGAISRGWMLAIVATDPERQAAAARLVETLLDPALNSAWTLAAGRLPTRRQALDMWDQDDPYVSFLRWQLEASVIHPSGSSYQEAAPILAKAQSDVLSGTADARSATDQATGLTSP